MEKFTTKDALSIQTNQLEEYEYRLKPELYQQLKSWVDMCNVNVSDNTNTVVRGVNIDNWIANNLRKPR